MPSDACATTYTPYQLLSNIDSENVEAPTMISSTPAVRLMNVASQSGGVHESLRSKAMDLLAEEPPMYGERHANLRQPSLMSDTSWAQGYGSVLAVHCWWRGLTTQRVVGCLTYRCTLGGCGTLFAEIVMMRVNPTGCGLGSLLISKLKSDLLRGLNCCPPVDSGGSAEAVHALVPGSTHISEVCVLAHALKDRRVVQFYRQNGLVQHPAAEGTMRKLHMLRKGSFLLERKLSNAEWNGRWKAANKIGCVAQDQLSAEDFYWNTSVGGLRAVQCLLRGAEPPSDISPISRQRDGPLIATKQDTDPSAGQKRAVSGGHAADTVVVSQRSQGVPSSRAVKAAAVTARAAKAARAAKFARVLNMVRAVAAAVVTTPSRPTPSHPTLPRPQEDVPRARTLAITAALAFGVLFQTWGPTPAIGVATVLGGLCALPSVTRWLQ